MAGEQQGNAGVAGFAGYRQPGFAEMAGSGSYGSIIPAVGFDADLKAYEVRERQAAASDQTQPSKQFPDKYDKEHDFKLEEDHTRLTDVSLSFGRKVAPRRRNTFMNFAEQVDKANSRAFQAVPHTQYMMNYFTRTVADGMIEGWLRNQTKRPLTPKEEVGRIRGLATDINSFLAREVQLEYDYEADLCDETPDLAALFMERRLDPDNNRWFELDAASTIETESSERHVEWASMYLPASFQVESIGGLAVNAISIVLEDRDGALVRGRNRVVDALDDKFGLNSGAVALEFQPEIDILTTVGGRSVAGLQWHVPGGPNVWPLDTPRAYESPR